MIYNKTLTEMETAILIKLPWNISEIKWNTLVYHLQINVFQRLRSLLESFFQNSTYAHLARRAWNQKENKWSVWACEIEKHVRLIKGLVTRGSNTNEPREIIQWKDGMDEKENGIDVLRFSCGAGQRKTREGDFPPKLSSCQVTMGQLHPSRQDHSSCWTLLPPA